MDGNRISWWAFWVFFLNGWTHKLCLGDNLWRAANISPIIWQLLCSFLSPRLINRRHRSLSITFSARSPPILSNAPHPPSISHLSNFDAPYTYHCWTYKNANQFFRLRRPSVTILALATFQSFCRFPCLRLSQCIFKELWHHNSSVDKIFTSKEKLHHFKTTSRMKMIIRAYLMREAWGFDIP